MLSETIRNVFEQLIPIYEDKIQTLTDDGDWFNELYRSYLAHGICNASQMILKEDISDEMKLLVTKFLTGSWYWYDAPVHVYTLEESIKCLQWRVDKMKSMLNQ